MAAVVLGVSLLEDLVILPASAISLISGHTDKPFASLVFSLR